MTGRLSVIRGLVEYGIGEIRLGLAMLKDVFGRKEDEGKD